MGKLDRPLTFFFCNFCKALLLVTTSCFKISLWRPSSCKNDAHLKWAQKCKKWVFSDKCDPFYNFSLSDSPVHQCRNCLSRNQKMAENAKLMAKIQQDCRTQQVPIWICLLLLLSYIGAGATVFCVYHGDWSFVDSFYFAFTVLWTIGKCFQISFWLLYNFSVNWNVLSHFHYFRFDG